MNEVSMADELGTIAQEAYIFLYPLVTMDLTRRQLTNIESGRVPGRGPMNTFAHIRTFPDADFRAVVRPNFDTLYSTAWLDVSREPMVISAPDTRGRYYLLPMLDMWTDVFAVPGKRTTGTSPGHWAIVGPGYTRQLAGDLERITAPTPYVWMIGRTQTNGPDDYPAVKTVQDGFTITPLSQWGRERHPLNGAIDPTVDMTTPPLEQIKKLPPLQFFAYAAELLKVNPPHFTDQPIIARVKRLGLAIGRSFDPENTDAAIRRALEQGATDGFKAIQAAGSAMGRCVNGWHIRTTSIGVYGTNYLQRAAVAMGGLGANLPEDAVYPLLVSDSEGKSIDGVNCYVLHFDKRELPPVDAFWSLSMYDQDGFAVANSISRFAIGDRDDLKYNHDGSLDLHIQSENPGKDKDRNWLPSPPSGSLGITMRLYSPRPEVLDGRWAPPAVTRVG
jgi:hypothetical protein